MEQENNTEPAAGLHAEMMCLLRIKEMQINFAKVRLYIYREDAEGNLANCRPCAACMEVIDQMGIKQINYTTEHGYAVEVRKHKISA